LLQKRCRKTIASPSHRTIALADTIDYRTIKCLRYRPNRGHY